MTPEDQQRIHAQAVERAFDAWLEKKWSAFGKWTARGLAAAVFVAVMKWVIMHGGLQ